MIQNRLTVRKSSGATLDREGGKDGTSDCEESDFGLFPFFLVFFFEVSAAIRRVEMKMTRKCPQR